ncbi:hypothetical protein MNBD_ALPHA03-1164 [hydrothermal vent metagenome]|uniref:Methyltransferase type 11 domain-containing protein n=1 Tax=hydrothermal vent metagenome TaxID=652676 RepID=A0A3B1B253_9ZZZZ
MGKDDKDIKISFKLRCLAWWNGYDIEDVKARLQAQGTGNFLDDDKVTEEPGPAAKEETVTSLPWDKLRMEMTQLIWGNGYCGPGGKEQIEKMCKLLGLNSKMSAIVIGAGFGGPARVLAEEFGVWITGFELSKELAERGMKMSEDAGLASKAIISHLDPAQEKPFDRSYDRAFSKEALYLFQDKEKILQDTYDTLKEGGLFLITDYTLSDADALENPDVRKWLKQEATQPYLATTAIMQEAIEKTGFSLRVNEDISDEYVKLIEGSWSKATAITKELSKKGAEGTKAIESLMAEAEFWALRAKLLKEGHIRVWRFLGYKQNAELR